MVRARGVRVHRSEAEATRRRLLELGVLRTDLAVAKAEEEVIFPVADSCGPRLPTVSFDFESQDVRASGYQDLLSDEARAVAPRAFDTIGDIVIVKVPPEASAHREAIGNALLTFHGARAVFHDEGVKDPFRVRHLVRIAGSGGSLTRLAENGVRLWVDPAQAYFSPRLATERERVAALVRPGEHVVDLFGGVAPFGVQAAIKGAVVDSIDLNPAAVELAKRNVAENRVASNLRLHLGDARAVAQTLPAADRVFMNLPHAAKDFLDVAARLAKPGATIHYHEILAPSQVASRSHGLSQELARHGWKGEVALTRVVRNYSPQEAHVAFDVVGP
jgi:tRNA (guanine37-N1)-methyltransferase